MRRESTQTLLNTLLIANIRENLPEEIQRGAWLGRNMQTSFRHQRQQTNCFQSYSLAAGVRAGNHHNFQTRFQTQINRHHMTLNQRVTRLLQINQAIIIQLTGRRSHILTKPRLGHNKIQPRQTVQAVI